MLYYNPGDLVAAVRCRACAESLEPTSSWSHA